MNVKLPLAIISTILIASVIALGCAENQIKNGTKTQAKSKRKIQFVCNKTYDEATQEYVYSTVAWHPENKKSIIVWKREDFSGNDFPPQKRCQKVSPRFQKAYDHGSLNYITQGIMNRQPVICTANRVGDDCDTLLITLKHQDNAQQTLEQLSDILLGYASAAIVQSSGEIAYSDDNRMYIRVDIEDFLSESQ